jgi:carbamoyl-phosphate synthase large subunit
MPAESASAQARVLITGTGGPSGISVMKALRMEPLEVFSADIDPYATGLYLVGEDRRLLIPRGDCDDYVPFVLEACRRHRIDVLVPTVDSELVPLAEARESFAALGTKIVLASAETLRICLDKWTLHQRCRDAVRVPHSVLADGAFDPTGIELPVIVKPRVGSGSRGIRLIQRLEALERIECDGTLLVQEHLPGTEHSLDVLARSDGQVIAVVPRSRLKVDSGIAITGRTVHDHGLETIGRQVAERIGLTSVANVQVKESTDGLPALLEVNPRFPGTMPLTVASGVNMPKLCVDDALGSPLPETMLPFEPLAMVRYFEERFFAFEEIEEMQTALSAVESLARDHVDA